jgi:hypothetical protein
VAHAGPVFFVHFEHPRRLHHAHAAADAARAVDADLHLVLGMDAVTRRVELIAESVEDIQRGAIPFLDELPGVAKPE